MFKLILLLVFVIPSCEYSQPNLNIYHGVLTYAIDGIPFKSKQLCINSQEMVKQSDRIGLIWANNLKQYIISYFDAVFILRNIRVCQILNPEFCDDTEKAAGCANDDGFWVMFQDDGKGGVDFYTCMYIVHEFAHMITYRFGLPRNKQHNTPIFTTMNLVQQIACKDF